MGNERVIKIKPGETVVIQSEKEQKEWLTISEFAKESGKSRTTIYDHIKNGKIKTSIVNGKTKINSNQLKF